MRDAGVSLLATRYSLLALKVVPYAPMKKDITIAILAVVAIFAIVYGL